MLLRRSKTRRIRLSTKQIFSPDPGRKGQHGSRTIHMRESIPVLQSRDFKSGVGVTPFDSENLRDRLNEVGRFHRNNHYICLVLKSGKATFSIGSDNLEVWENNLFLMRPGQVHRLIEIEKINGWMVFFDDIPMNEADMNALDHFIGHSPLLVIEKQDTIWFSDLFALMHSANAGSETAYFKSAAMRHLFTSGLYRIAGIYHKVKKKQARLYSPRSIIITQKFFHLVRHHLKDYRYPVEYARAMNISVGYLNDSVKTVTGFTVSGYLQKQIITEAKHLLAHSHLSIKEVSAGLGIKDPKYFHRIFSRHEGQSPTDFRKSNFEI